MVGRRGLFWCSRHLLDIIIIIRATIRIITAITNHHHRHHINSHHDQVGRRRHIHSSQPLSPIRVKTAQDGVKACFKWQRGRTSQFSTGWWLRWLNGTHTLISQVVFCSRSLEVSQAERIHLSNLALLAYCQQTLTKPTLSRCVFFFGQIYLLSFCQFAICANFKLGASCLLSADPDQTNPVKVCFLIWPNLPFIFGQFGIPANFKLGAPCLLSANSDQTNAVKVRFLLWPNLPFIILPICHSC